MCGEEVIIARAGQPMMRLEPIQGFPWQMDKKRR
jgi:hypothetical protein